MQRRFCLVSIAFLSAIIFLATKASAADAPATSVALITKAYDVRDLLIDIPDFNDQPTLGIQPLTATNHSPITKSRAEISKAFIDWVRAAGASVEWAGGGSVEETKGQMTVRASQPTQERITRRLNEARARRNIQISLQTFILIPDAETLNNFPDDLREKIAAIEMPTLRGVSLPLNPKDMATLFDQRLWSKSSTLITAPRITIFNNQTAFTLVSTQTNYVAGFERSSDGKNSMLPQTRTVQSGISTVIRGSAASDSDQIAAELKLEVASLKGLTKIKYNAAPVGQPTFYQVPDVASRRVNQILTLKSDQPVLIEMRGESSWEHDLNVFAVVRATVIRQR